MSRDWVFWVFDIFLISIWLFFRFGRRKMLRQFPGIYHFIWKYFEKVLTLLKHEVLTVRMLEKGQVDQVISRFIRLSEYKKPLKYYYLGYASLYSSKPDDAIFYFKKHLPFALGNEIQDTKGLIATAFLQKKEYFEASSFLEESRREGRVLIIPYILFLLVTSQYDKAKDFFEMYSEKVGPYRKLFESLVSFNGINPIRIESVPPSLYLYRNIIEAIQQQCSMEIYFNDPSSMLKLQGEIKTAIHTLSEHPLFFQSTIIQWIRKYLKELTLDKPVWFEGVELLFEVVKDPNIKHLFKKIEWFCKDNSERVKPNEIYELFSKMLPNGVKQTYHHESSLLQYVVFEDEKMKLGFQKSVLWGKKDFHFQFRILSLTELQEMNLLIPLESSFQLAPKDMKWQFEQIIFEWAENRSRKLHWLEHVMPLIENIPTDYQSSLDGIKRYYEEFRLPYKKEMSIKPKYTGVGWLILVIVGLILTPIITSLDIYENTYDVVWGYSSVITLDSLDIFILVFDIILVIGSVILLVLMLLKSRLFPKAMIIWLLSVAVLSLIETVLELTDHYVENYTLIRFVILSISAAILVPYLLVSKRVKNTFLNINNENKEVDTTNTTLQQ